MCEWFRKTAGFLIAAFGPVYRPVIEWVEDQDNIITNEAIDQQFGPASAEPVGDVQQSVQVHVALLTSTESESFDIVLGAAPSGLEALTSLGFSRWKTPQSFFFCNISWFQTDANCKIFPLHLKWEELVRRDERSKSSGTTTAAFDEGIKTAALEGLVPSESEQHLVMNRARLITNQQVRIE